MKNSSLYVNLCSYENLFLAYKKARKHKTQKDYIIEFEKNLEENLIQLRTELLLHCYNPKPLITFVIRDPKIRKISKSDFRDRVIHHALCNIIEPIFEKGFIYDSYANRIGKGTHKAIERFDIFKRKASKNNTNSCFVLKADITHYFDEIDHNLSINIIRKKVSDERIIWLIKMILANYSSKQTDAGMPLGNLTSQFFANVYLNELDQFVKHKLRARYYIRYVDDFILLEKDRRKLEFQKEKIHKFLKSELNLQLHPDKSKIFRLGNSLSFLGFRIFYHHKLLKKSSIRKMKFILKVLKESYYKKELDYDGVCNSLEGWLAHAKNANTYKIRKNVLADFERGFPRLISTKEIDKYYKPSKINSPPAAP